jgi:uncharacterized protein YecE (DUF72 family)
VPAPRVFVGCAAWALPRAHRRRFPTGESNLARYAARLSATEINSSFYHPHLAATYARWAAGVPKDFRFSVKIPKTISHELRLVKAGAALDAFLEGVVALGDKLGCLLLQLPPSLAFERREAERFFRMLRKRHKGAVVAEPRHSSWFTPEAERSLIGARIGLVAADPAHAGVDMEPGAWRGVAYYRLHGSPVIYRSSYGAAYLGALAKRLKAHAAAGEESWCIFDNTMLGAATANALDLAKRVGTTAASRPPRRRS